MEKYFPRPGEWEQGGETMIVTCFRTYAASRSRTALLRNPLPPHKKEQRNTFPALTVGWYRSARRKTSPKTSPIRLLSGRINPIGIRPQNGRAVTTSHLFWPNQRRRTGSLLPIWLRNSDIIGRQYDQEAERGGRGGSVGRSRQDVLIHKLTRNFWPNARTSQFA